MSRISHWEQELLKPWEAHQDTPHYKHYFCSTLQHFKKWSAQLRLQWWWQHVTQEMLSSQSTFLSRKSVFTPSSYPYRSMICTWQDEEIDHCNPAPLSSPGAWLVHMALTLRHCLDFWVYFLKASWWAQHHYLCGSPSAILLTWHKVQTLFFEWISNTIFKS